MIEAYDFYMHVGFCVSLPGAGGKSTGVCGLGAGLGVGVTGANWEVIDPSFKK